MKDIERTLVLLPRTVKAIYLRARIRLYQGLLPEAKRDAQEILRTIPDHGGALRIIDQIGPDRVGT
jgi:hypothetical protein